MPISAFTMRRSCCSRSAETRTWRSSSRLGGSMRWTAKRPCGSPRSSLRSTYAPRTSAKLPATSFADDDPARSGQLKPKSPPAIAIKGDSHWRIAHDDPRAPIAKLGPPSHGGGPGRGHRDHPRGQLRLVIAEGERMSADRRLPVLEKLAFIDVQVDEL